MKLNLCLILFVALSSFSSKASPISFYNPSKTYVTGDIVIFGESENSYIMWGSGTSLGQAPASNPSVWTDLAAVADALNIPVESVSTLSISTIFNSIPSSALPDESTDYSYFSRSTERREYKHTANIEIYSPLIDYSALFASDGVDIINYQVSDLGLSSGKVRVNGAMRIQGVYTTFNGEFNSFTTSQDANGNGIPDYYEKNLYYGMKMS
jgi:hypothetical protein